MRDISVTRTDSVAFGDLALVGEVPINQRHSYRIALIEHRLAPRHPSASGPRRFVEIRLLEHGRPTRWRFHLDPKCIGSLIQLLGKGAKMARTMP